MFKYELDSKTKVAEFIKQLMLESEQLVKETFPMKMLEINELFKQIKARTPQDIEQNIEIPYPLPLEHAESLQHMNIETNPAEPNPVKFDFGGGLQGHKVKIPGTRVIVFPGERVTCNKYVHDYCEKVKSLVCGLMEHANMVKMWLKFLIPKIEDDHIFRGSIQESMMFEVKRIEDKANKYLDQITDYYQKRGYIISEISKYPHIEDYRQFIKVFDEAELLKLQNAILEIRNHYASLFDLIMKNSEKIKVPQSWNSLMSQISSYFTFLIPWKKND